MALTDESVSFDPDFAGPAEWADLYRRNGLQVVPAHFPDARNPAFQWKRPKLPDWKQLQEEIVPDLTFARWYGSGGEHASREQMGVLTGHCSGNIGVIDLDTHTKPASLHWWRGLLAVHNNGIEPETWEQKTGGGGRQILFVFPADFVIPTIKTSLGVDIRGQGGFAMLPPSRHESGACYQWCIGRAPYDISIELAPDWLCEALMELWSEHGGGTTHTGPVERVASSGADMDAFGSRVDGREDFMTRLVWGAVLDMHRECPLKPSEAEASAAMRQAYQVYERAVKSRLAGDEPKSSLLEREGRGASLFADKWKRAIAKWEREVAQGAALPKLAPDDWDTARNTPDDSVEEKDPARFVFEKISDLRALPEAQWLVKDWFPEQATGIIYGKWGAGKSFIAFDLALHLAYGMLDWHGAELPGEECPVLVIAREGHHGFVKRIDAFKKHHGIVDDTDRIVFMRASVSFMNANDFFGLCTAVQATGLKFRAVFVDTVARVTAGEDTNEQSIATLFMERCQVLGELTGATCFGVHHQNKAGTMMGSVYFEANADFVFEVSRHGEEGTLEAGEIRCTKSKDGEDGWKRSIAYAKVATNDITGEGSLVVKSISEDPAGAPKKASGPKWPDKEICRRVLATIDREWALGLPLSLAPNSSPKRRAAQVLSREFTLDASLVREMLHAWIDNGILKQGPTGDTKTKSHGLQVIGRID